MTRIYLDHNATAPLDAQVGAWLRRASRVVYGNPASLHAEGRQAKLTIDTARQGVADLLGCTADQVIFTSGGTEANNLAVHAARQKSRQALAVRTAIEHPAVAKPVDALRDDGWRVTVLPVSAVGHVADWAPAADAGLVCAMLANNEVGTVLDLAAARASAPRAWLHCDAVQAIGKLPVQFGALQVDSLAVSGHKFGAPPGVGLLLVRNAAAVAPLLVGGGQEGGWRSGTPSALLIGSLHVALHAAVTLLTQRTERMRLCRDALEAVIVQGLHGQGVQLLGDVDRRLPNTSCLAFAGISAEALVTQLDAVGVATATGSACSSGSGKVSPVLLALGGPTTGVLRLSTGPTTTLGQVRRAAALVVQAVHRLRHLAGHQG